MPCENPTNVKDARYTKQGQQFLNKSIRSIGPHYDDTTRKEKVNDRPDGEGNTRRRKQIGVTI